MPSYEHIPLQYEWDENKRDETWRERKIDFASVYDSIGKRQYTGRVIVTENRGGPVLV